MIEMPMNQEEAVRLANEAAELDWHRRRRAGATTEAEQRRLNAELIGGGYASVGARDFHAESPSPSP